MEFLSTLVLAASLGAPVVGPTGVELEPLIDTTVQLPGTTDPLILDGPPPVPCGDGVVFRAAEVSASMSWAYYVTPSLLEVFVDEDTPIPGVGEDFEGLGDIRCIGSDRFAFLGWRDLPNAIPSSAFQWQPGGAIELIQSGGTTIDGHDFGDLVDLGGNTGAVGLQGRLEPLSLGEALAIKPISQAPIFVADEQVILPGRTDPVSSFASPQMLGNDLLFRALVVTERGLYRWSQNSGFSVVADTATPAPGGVGNFQSIGQYTVLSIGVAFTASYSGGVGIFLYNNQAEIEPLIVAGDVTVGGETVVSAALPSGQGGLVSFSCVTADTDPFTSVCARTADGMLYRILGVQDLIEGQTVLTADGAADHDSVVVRVLTDDLVGRIYQVSFGEATEIPVLSASATAVLVLVLVVAAAMILGSRGA